MLRLLLIQLLLAASLVASHALDVCGAEIRLRRECQPTTNLVTLADVAKIFAHDRETVAVLEAVELLPAPVAGSQQTLRAREIQDLLDARGVNLAEHTFSGSSQVVIGKGSPEQRPPRRLFRLTSAAKKKAEENATEAVLQHVRQQTGSTSSWGVELELDDDQLIRLLDATGTVLATGGSEPWSGNQAFVLEFATLHNQVRMDVEGRLTPSRQIVVAVRALRRGVTIRDSDVKLQQVGPHQNQKTLGEVFSKIEDVVGLETRRAVRPGESLTGKHVGPRLMVRRGDVVTVYARRSGVEVRIHARASEDGSRDEMIQVELMNKSREKLYVRVSGDQEVDVMAHQQHKTALR